MKRRHVWWRASVSLMTKERCLGLEERKHRGVAKCLMRRPCLCCVVVCWPVLRRWAKLSVKGRLSFLPCLPPSARSPPPAFCPAASCSVWCCIRKRLLCRVAVLGERRLVASYVSFLLPFLSCCGPYFTPGGRWMLENMTSCVLHEGNIAYITLNYHIFKTLEELDIMTYTYKPHRSEGPN